MFPIKSTRHGVSALILVLCFGFLYACEQPTNEAPQINTATNHQMSHSADSDNQPPSSRPPSSTLKPKAPLYTDDLDNLKTRGVLRLLAPSYEREDHLVRDGLPINEYARLAEQFAASLDLRAQWHYVDNFDELIPLLEKGSGDIIVTNLTHTKSRAKRVNFTIPINTVDEVLVVPLPLKGHALSDLPPMAITVPRGTSYEETANELVAQYPQLLLNITTSELSDQQMIDKVADGLIQATIIDSNILYPYLNNQRNQHSKLSYNAVAGPVVKAKRSLAWATRRDNVHLLNALNHFLIAQSIQSSNNRSTKRDWPEIQSSKSLRIITSNNPASYFIWRGELMGFDYDIMKKFARDHRLRLEVIVRESTEEQIQALLDGEGDLIAASMTDTAQRRNMGITFSKPYLQVTEQLIGSKKDAPITELTQLAGKTVVVNPEKSYLNSLVKLQSRTAPASDLKSDVEQPDTIPHFRIMAQLGATTEELIETVAKGEYDYTVADSHLAAIESTYRNDIQVLFDISEKRNIAWGLRKDQPQLKAKLDDFIADIYRGLFYNVTYNKYFKNSKSIIRHKTYRIEPNKPISPFDELVKKNAILYGLDWRLVTSQMYQESKFNPRARSRAGALGLMQVLPRTAHQMGYQNLFNPENGIAAGVSYLHWLNNRFKADLPIEERVYFTLAAYNAGYGHVRDAIELTEKLGKDPYRWFDNVEHSMLLLAKPKYARQARHGYVRGAEPVKYVKLIRERYLNYLRIHTDPGSASAKL